MRMTSRLDLISTKPPQNSYHNIFVLKIIIIGWGIEHYNVSVLLFDCETRPG
jgi:hypothetical protein